MNTIFSLVVAIQVCAALVIIGLVLVQHGKGADMGAAFGSGASGSLFGATGSSSFLSKATGIAATIFFCSTLGLAYIGTRHAAPSGGVMDNLSQQKTTEVAPAASAGSASTAASTSAPTSTAIPAPAPAAATKAASNTGHADQIPK
ncbi:preprotein translocase subunit SecG [Solimicrobium silvestre]|uniref:Protein-export membrane protein SecG n=1 Tax=Solimicrobium silvestre TaxID=2099400 RepID=A0A2S9GVF2_9BURK|nr:preprotein translocase subunit SecG [Solimicrobium silvestre]PRC91699.1 secG: preprotein translocase, SecG subunit [Solimicrobium silvestre]